jgi:hypothetical protein
MGNDRIPFDVNKQLTPFRHKTVFFLAIKIYFFKFLLSRKLTRNKSVTGDLKMLEW